MANVAVIVGAAIVNAIAFTVGNALHDKFGRTDGSEERSRHDKAVEDLQKATTARNQKRMETLDFIINEVKHKNDAKNTFDNVDRALEFYNQTHRDTKISLPYRPVLQDFPSLYKPSPEHNYYETAVATIIGEIAGYAAFKLLH